MKRLTALTVVAAGVCVVYIGFALAVTANLGTGPFNVLQQGVAMRLGISMGQAGWLNGSLFVAVGLGLRQRPGIATIMAVAVGGIVLDAVLVQLGTPREFEARLAMMLAGLALMSGGGALYLWAGLGASPVDGLMTALHRRFQGAVPISVVRTGLEMTALAAGGLAGGAIGVGTMVIGLGIGPGLQLGLRLLPPHERAAAAIESFQDSI